MTITREEAIKTLKELWRGTNDQWYEETYAMAIDALSEPSGDLISRADAIERFCEFGTSLERQGKTMITMVDAKYAFIKTLESLPSAEADWIPVSEGLPDPYVPVLVSDGVYVWEDELQEDYEDGVTMYWWDSQCSLDFKDTAWMPRPKPYRKDGK